jgi:hypothetical protein
MGIVLVGGAVRGLCADRQQDAPFRHYEDRDEVETAAGALGLSKSAGGFTGVVRGLSIELRLAEVSVQEGFDHRFVEYAMACTAMIDPPLWLRLEVVPEEKVRRLRVWPALILPGGSPSSPTARSNAAMLSARTKSCLSSYARPRPSRPSLSPAARGCRHPSSKPRLLKHSQRSRPSSAEHAIGRGCALAQTSRAAESKARSRCGPFNTRTRTSYFPVRSMSKQTLARPVVTDSVQRALLALKDEVHRVRLDDTRVCADLAGAVRETALLSQNRFTRPRRRRRDALCTNPTRPYP